jgi:hypothetical protein
LLGLVLPDTATVFPLKIVFGGISGLGAGLLFITSGLEGALTWGTLMAACGITLIGLGSRSLTRAVRAGR